MEKAFHAYGTKMRALTEFKYLGRVLTNTDDDWPAMAGNISKAQASWGRLARILRREGADLKVTHRFYTAVTQQVLLFWGGVMGPHQEDGVCPGRLPGQGSTAFDRTNATP